jgi:uncharacterized protein YigE (DUF2233 family)
MRASSWFPVAVSAAVLFLTPGHAGRSLAEGHACAGDVFEGAAYVVCSVQAPATDLSLFWKDAEGRPLRNFSNVAKAVAATGSELIFAVNGGMYRPDYTPVGLHIENGQELRPADRSSVDGPPAKVPNFYKKPNGVFFVGEDGAGVLTTDAFLQKRPNARFATQSGPMLVIDGSLHPAFIPGSTDRTRRSGVGICTGGTVRFAISNDAVNFHDFARLFRDRLDCPNALFLDGGRGVGLHVPALGRSDWSWYGGYGPIIGLVARR